MAISPKDGAAPPAAGNAIAVTCPCGKTALVKTEHAGKKVKCPKCERVLMVPSLETIAHPQSESLSSGNPQLQTEGDDRKSTKDLWSFLAPAQSNDEIGRLGGRIASSKCSATAAWEWSSRRKTPLSNASSR